MLCVYYIKVFCVSLFLVVYKLQAMKDIQNTFYIFDDISKDVDCLVFNPRMAIIKMI